MAEDHLVKVDDAMVVVLVLKVALRRGTELWRREETETICPK